MFFLFAVANVCTVADIQCVRCKKVKELFDLVNRKLDKMIANGGCGGDGGPPSAPVCKPINFENLENATAKLVIDSIKCPYGVVADGNDVYVSSCLEKNVYRFNQVTNPGNDAAEIIPSPTINPMYLDIKDGFLYMDTFGENVYRMNLGIAGSNIEKIITVSQAAGIRWSPDGKQILLGIFNKANKGAIAVYNEKFQLVAQFPTDTRFVQDIGFDRNGNIRITDSTNEIRIFDKDTYKLMRNITLPVFTVGFTEHCDGTIILADPLDTSLLFLNEDYDLLKTVTVAGSERLCDVAITEDGTLYVTDYSTRMIYLYDLF